jgi:hypothetical protein
MSRAHKTTDPLLTTVEEIRAEAEKLGFTVFYGWAHGNDETTVYWNPEHGGSWKDFLACGKSLDVRILYLSWAPFEEFQIDDALEELGRNSVGPESPGSNSLVGEIEGYRKQVGLTATVDMAFKADGILHICEIQADWFKEFEAITDKTAEEKAAIKEQPVDKVLVNQWAEKLATHPSYGTCKSNDQREYLVEKLAGKEYDTLPLGHIMGRAETIYQFEVKPEVEKQLREQARVLREQGLNMNAIALRLKVSKERISGLLAE